MVKKEVNFISMFKGSVHTMLEEFPRFWIYDSLEYIKSDYFSTSCYI